MLLITLAGADTVQICNVCRSGGWDAEPLFYSDSEQEKVSKALAKADAFIIHAESGSYLGC